MEAVRDPNDLTPDQLSLHLLQLNQNNLSYIKRSGYDGETLTAESPMTEQEGYSTYYSLPTVKLESNSSENQIVYKLNVHDHCLVRVAIYQRWPELRVRPEYPDIEICWTHNRGTAIFEKIIMRIGTDEIPALDNRAADTGQFFLTKNHKSQERLMGNNDYEEQWTRHLPGSETCPTLPFSFSRSKTANAFPNFRLESADGANFLLIPRLHLSKLLRMRRIIRDSEGRNRYEVFHEIGVEQLKCLTGLPTGEKLGNPDLYAQILNTLKNEKDNILSCNPSRLWRYDDFIALESSNALPYGSKYDFDVKDLSVAKAMYVMAQPTEAVEINCHGNYTSNPHNPYEGWDPIASVAYVRQGKTYNLPLAVIKNNMSEYWPKLPNTLGILAIPFCINPRHIDETVGICFGKTPGGKITVTLADNSPYRDQDRKQLFKIYVLLQVVRGVEFKMIGGQRSYVVRKMDGTS